LCTLWPFPVERVRALSKRVKRIVVPEMNLGQMVYVVEAAAKCDVVPFNQMDGTVIYPSSIVDALRRSA
jgi:2-oxoglutarate ferredoxin oxidoreductase subunit alpha